MMARLLKILKMTFRDGLESHGLRVGVGLLTLQFCFSFAPAHADLYRFSVSDADVSRLIIVKNCLDYTFCTHGGAALAGGDPEYRFHTYLELPNDSYVKAALERCNFTKEKLKLSIANETTKKDIALKLKDNGRNVRPYYRNVYLRNLSEAEKRAKFGIIEGLLKQGNEQAAIDAIIREYHLPRNGYQVLAAPELGNNAAGVADHELKIIKIGPSSTLSHTCEFIQTVRHELEHSFQFKRAEECVAKGKSHGFFDHNTRERSAYLNDIQNIPKFCPDRDFNEILIIATFNTMVENYF